jgi:hypothetical protein
MTYQQISDNLDTVSSLQIIPAKWSLFRCELACVRGGEVRKIKRRR